MNVSKYAIGVGLAVSGLCVTVAPARAVSFGPTEINGVQYDITTIQGSYATPSSGSGPHQAELEDQPWWGNSSLAKDVATRVGQSLGLGNIPKNFNTSNPNNEGPYFAFEVNSQNRVSAWNWDSDKNHGAGGIELDTHNNFLTGDFIWAIATPIPSTTTPGPVTPVPTPALLPALLGFGVKVFRRQQQSVAKS